MLIVLARLTLETKVCLAHLFYAIAMLTLRSRTVYASPRAIAAFVTQCNTIDLTRRSPSYENRLSKYSHRGFEVHWPGLDRTRIDPTIFERSFGRTQGLARLLILEK